MENELQSKLEDISEIFATNTKIKIEKETNSMYNIIKLIVILGFVSFLMFGLLIYYINENNKNNENNLKYMLNYCNPKTVQREQIINIQFQKADNLNYFKHFKHFKHFKTEIHNNKLCKYYNDINPEVSEFYTICKKINIDNN